MAARPMGSGSPSFGRCICNGTITTDGGQFDDGGPPTLAQIGGNSQQWLRMTFTRFNLNTYSTDDILHVYDATTNQLLTSRTGSPCTV